MRTRYLALVVGLFAMGCVPQPVEWDEERSVAESAGDVAAGALDGAALPSAAGGVEPPGVTGTPPAPNACPGSVRVAATRGPERYAVWWAPRADSSAQLLAARSSDGAATWVRHYVVDSLDRGTRGCQRSAPAIAADSTNGYVHITYALDAPEGAGIFYAHLMDPRARFEVPVAIVYGDRAGASAVASDDSSVVVAYENPNTARSQVAVAVSRTAGHSFESKSIDVSSPDTDAGDPRVAVRGARIAVEWGGAGGMRVRTGRIK